MPRDDRSYFTTSPSLCFHLLNRKKKKMENKKEPNYKYWYHHESKAIQQTFDSTLINVICPFRIKKGGKTSILYSEGVDSQNQSNWAQGESFVILLFRDVKCCVLEDISCNLITWLCTIKNEKWIRRAANERMMIQKNITLNTVWWIW